MTALENKILEDLKKYSDWMAEYDEDRQKEYDDYMKQAEQQESEFWKKEYEQSAKWAIHFQKHGYAFLSDWKNVISKAMYERLYEIWHSAEAGKRKGTGHGAYITSELSEIEMDNIDKVFNALVNRGYLRLSKSGKMATYKRRNRGN